jgi:hypothetical protein
MGPRGSRQGGSTKGCAAVAAKHARAGKHTRGRLYTRTVTELMVPVALASSTRMARQSYASQ